MVTERPEKRPRMASTDQETAATLDRLVKAVNETWNTPLGEPLHRRQRFGYAFAGSISWVFYNFDPYWSNVLASLSGGRLLLTAIVMQLALGAWFAGLISYQDRRCSPSRFCICLPVDSPINTGRKWT